MFSSVGDNTYFHRRFIGNNMNYDVYIMYYGDNDEIYNEYKAKVHFSEKRKGSKFQNFKYFYETYPDIINQYDYFFILDDDIIINVAGINTMFDVASRYNLSICGPSFIPPSKKSVVSGRNKPDILLTYTNFVEVNTPLFNKVALDKIMAVLAPELIGWGIDYLYMWANGLDNTEDYAIVHAVKCINPPDLEKPIKRREILELDGAAIRKLTWETYATSIGCPIKVYDKEYENVPVANL